MLCARQPGHVYTHSYMALQLSRHSTPQQSKATKLPPAYSQRCRQPHVDLVLHGSTTSVYRSSGSWLCRHAARQCHGGAFWLHQHTSPQIIESVVVYRSSRPCVLHSVTVLLMLASARVFATALRTFSHAPELSMSKWVWRCNHA